MMPAPGARTAPAAPLSPSAKAPPAPCTYALHLLVEAACTVTVGKLGTFRFPAGRYTYTGSARRNLEARIRRHRSRDKRLRWHIDYLLTTPAVRVTSVERSTLDECTLNGRTAGAVLVPGFGASDCTRGCGSHLKFHPAASSSRTPAHGAAAGAGP